MLSALFNRRRSSAATVDGAAAAAAGTAEVELFERISATLAHDLRNPLNTIGLNIHLARTAIEQDDRQLGTMAVDHVERAKQQMLESVERFRALARALYGDVVREPVDVAGLAHDLRERLGGSVMPAEIELTIHDLPHTTGDPKLAAALLWGLLCSALEATRGQPGRRIEIGHVPDTEPAVYYVSDDGADLERTRGNSSVLWQRIGSASQVAPWLDLAVRGVARHGGEVQAAPGPGGGAIVRFRLAGPERRSK